MPPSHSTWLFHKHSCENCTSFLIDTWNLYFLQCPWKFYVSSTPVTCLVWIWNSPVLLVCIHIVLGSTAPFSSSRVGSHIFKSANIGMLTFLLLFSRQEIHKKSTKSEGFQCALTEVALVKNSEIKSNYKFNLCFTFEIINPHNRSCRKLFLLLLLNPLFHYSNLPKVFNWPCTSHKTVWLHQNSFFPLK